MELAAGQVGALMRAAGVAHRQMLESARRLTDAGCRGPSLLPGWSRGHVLAHWARNADGQARMLEAARRGEVAAQYPGGDAQRAAGIEAGGRRPARTLLAAALAAAVTAGCGAVPAAPPHRRLTASAAITLTRPQACRQLLDDVTRHRGVPDVPALRRIADHVTDPRMAGDARTAVRDIGHTGAAPVAFALLRDDCAQAGVRIPAP